MGCKAVMIAWLLIRMYVSMDSFEREGGSEDREGQRERIKKRKLFDGRGGFLVVIVTGVCIALETKRPDTRERDASICSRSLAVSRLNY